MNSKLLYIVLTAGSFAFVTSCKKDIGAPPPPPPSDGKSIQLNGGIGGSNAVNSVYVDFSASNQDSVKRIGWDLGFRCGTDFRVIINNTAAASAKVISKNDLTQVTATDTIGFADALQLGNGLGSMDICDNVDGDITKTVIAPPSATDADNKVYIVKPSNGFIAPNKDWYKVRILRNGAGYRLQYAKLSETTVKTIDIPKDDSYNFRYVSFDNNSIVKVEPAKDNWDFMWSATTYKAGPTLPFTFADFVVINYFSGVQAAEVLTSTVSFVNYAEANIATTTFNNNKNAIGSAWRTASPTTTSVKTDRFYVIKDAAGNVYKLKFVSFAAQDGGERGKPVIEYKLVKKA